MQSTQPSSMPSDPTALSLAVGGNSRSMMAGPGSRSMDVDQQTIDLEARTVEISISSEFPVETEFGFEILDHTASSIIFTRMRDAPLLMDHDRGNQIGKVEEVWLTDDRRLRARIRFSRHARAEEVWLDLVDGIRTNFSISYFAYMARPEREVDGVLYYRVVSWEPYEVSSVSVPADPTIGHGRAAPKTHTLTIRGNSMSAENTGSNPAPVVDPALAERQRAQDIYALGETHGQRELAQKAIADGTSVDRMRSLLLANLATSAPLSAAPSPSGNGELPNFMQPGQNMRELGIQDKEIKSYSLMRAINAMATGNWKEAGFERSVSLAIADASKKQARGLYVPHEVVFSRQLEKGTPGKGGVLVDTELRVDQFVDVLRNKAMIGRLGARVLSGLQGDLAIPRKTSGTNFYWLAGENSEPDFSDFDFSTMALSPKTIAGALAVTRRLRQQSSMSVENLMRQDMIEGIAVAIDKAQLTGNGKDNQPLGLIEQIGLPGSTYDKSVSWDHIVDMETAIAVANADESGMAYLTSPTQRGSAKKTQVFPNTGERLWDRDNTVNGYKAYASNQVPSDAWIFGDWSQIITALWGVMDINVDTAKLAGSDGLVLRVFQDVDTNVRRLQSFNVLRKAIA